MPHGEPPWGLYYLLAGKVKYVHAKHRKPETYWNKSTIVGDAYANMHILGHKKLAFLIRINRLTTKKIGYPYCKFDDIRIRYESMVIATTH